MALIEFFLGALSALSIYEPYQKPRRVFTRGFVMFCVLVAVVELIALNHFYGARG
ncbi:hypothetical protein [Pseudomonas sp. SJZ131]|uniref:hypothetical protein n=1 Tax=Pseudomonas sp. SJZ131 TaxID=2572895 RepID=UPI0011993833|nr:hypothetical protein [Pseudomonas sp. SJZ131]TWD52541.1 hypothetical protein FBY12_1067 [Pseudomonas sp. SJZ131]